MDGGKVKIPHGSGLGAEIDEEKLKECILAPGDLRRQ
jgi:L-alanine-DL-glutamate epimerase-like enolase superfamily enzyme